MSLPRPHLLCERHEAAVYEWVVMEGGERWASVGVAPGSSLPRPTLAPYHSPVVTHDDRELYNTRWRVCRLTTSS